MNHGAATTQAGTRPVRVFGILAAAALLFGLGSGCASMFARGAVGVDELYIGTKTDWALVTQQGKGDFGAYTDGLAPLAAIDLPLSLVLDTVLLPVDVFLIPGGDR